VSSPLASPAESRGRPLPHPDRSSTRADPWGALTPDPFGGGVRLVPVASGAWRLCDGDAAADDPSGIVAYLERDETGIDVVWLQGAAGHEHYASIEDVLAAARRVTNGALSPLTGSAGPSRPIPIPHFAPPPS
jgi:hypothetical protein